MCLFKLSICHLDEVVEDLNFFFQKFWAIPHVSNFYNLLKKIILIREKVRRIREGRKTLQCVRH